MSNLIAQNKYFFEENYSKVVFETNAHFGEIYRHSDKFKPNVTEFTYNFEQTISIRNLNKKPWQQKLHYPEVVTYIHSSFGNKEIFGSANGLFTHVNFWFNHNKIADTYFSVGITNNTVGVAKPPVYIHSLYYARYTSVANKVWSGASFETNFSAHDKLLFEQETENLKWKSSNLSLFVADEIILENVGVSFLFGAYILDNAYRGALIYAKLGINYYYYEFGKHDHKLFLGVNLKTHYTTAQVV
ncbi:MAG: hypothetical protein ACPG4Z_00100 [Chitinophagales bacterium]